MTFQRLLAGARAASSAVDDLARQVDADHLAVGEPRLQQVEHDAAAGPDLDDAAGPTKSSMRCLVGAGGVHRLEVVRLVGDAIELVLAEAVQIAQRLEHGVERDLRPRVS